MPKIIHENGPAFKSAGERAERQMLDILKDLPEEYYILRECKFRPSKEKQTTGSQENRADFIVMGPEIGILILEVKDWNILCNEYTPINQYQIRKFNRKDKTVTQIKNPWEQAQEYFQALMELFKKSCLKERLWISYAVIYPNLTRAEFNNSLINPQPDNLQTRFLVDLEKTLFRDDLLGSRDSLLTTLKRYVIRNIDTHAYLPNYTQEHIVEAVNWLIPAEMRVGGLPDNSEAERKLILLDEEQQNWAFSPAFIDKKYLSDVAGSGKTNVLLSRAIYWAKQHYDKGGCRILVTTYNEALKYELERIFNQKIMYDPLEEYYKDTIYIYDIVAIMEKIMEIALANDFQQWKEEVTADVEKETYIEQALPQECSSIIQEQPELAIYDYLLIDEVQDFNTRFLKVAMGLLREKNNLFAVGDIGQKLFDRRIEWWDFDLETERVALQSRFLMYRSPQPIAKLAWKFLIKDPTICQSLQDENYSLKVKPKSPLQTLPIFTPFTNEDDLLKHISDDIQNYLQITLPQKILCIGLRDGLLLQLKHKLVNLGLPVREATDAPAHAGNYILLADYIEAKGLERDYVFILDADHLAQRQGIFGNQEQYQDKIGKDRIKLFVALTRAMREVRLYYVDRQHIFIEEICKLQADMNR